MNRVLTRFCACATLCVPLAMIAQENGAEGGVSAEVTVEAVEASLAKAAVAKSGAKHFHALVKLAYSSDNVSVKLPRQNEFKPAEEGKYYPNGSVFRVTAAAEPAVFEFGPETFVKVKDDAEFGTREVAIGEKSRVVTMVGVGFRCRFRVPCQQAFSRLHILTSRSRTLRETATMSSYRPVMAMRLSFMSKPVCWRLKAPTIRFPA